MRDTIFLQFITKNRFHDYYDLGNGFSDTYDFCKTKGDFYYVEHRGLHWASMGRMLSNTVQYEKFEEMELPFSKGTVYACVMVFSHMYQLWVWAKKYPDIKFIVGGPGAFSKMYVMPENFPSNMTLWEESLEDYFGFENFSYPWKIKIPDQVKGKNISLAYTLESKCYWGKCGYCNYAFCKQRKREDINFGFEDIEHDGLKIVRLHSPSMSPALMKEVLPRLPERNDIRYDTYIRTAPGENKVLRDLVPKTSQHQMRFVTGMEFPSNNVLTFISKGITMKDVYDTIDIFKDSKHKLMIFNILFMDNLTEKHLDDAQNFIDKIPPNNNITLNIARLIIKPYTEFFDRYSGTGTHINLGPFYYGYVNTLSDEQIILNKKIKKILYQYPLVKDFTKGILSFDNDEKFKKYNVYRDDV